MSDINVSAKVEFVASTGELVRIVHDNRVSTCARLSVFYGSKSERKIFAINIYEDDLRKLSEAVDAMRAILNR